MLVADADPMITARSAWFTATQPAVLVLPARYNAKIWHCHDRSTGSSYSQVPPQNHMPHHGATSVHGESHRAVLHNGYNPGWSHHHTSHNQLSGGDRKNCCRTLHPVWPILDRPYRPAPARGRVSFTLIRRPDHTAAANLRRRHTPPSF